MPMNLVNWIDTGATPPQRLPSDLDAAIAYVSDVLGHVVYLRWTLALVKRRYPSLSDAKSAKPAVMRLLLDRTAAVEYWDRGRARVVSLNDAPTPERVLARVLHLHAQRFKCGETALPAITNGERLQGAGADGNRRPARVAGVVRPRRPLRRDHQPDQYARRR